MQNLKEVVQTDIACQQVSSHYNAFCREDVRSFLAKEDLHKNLQIFFKTCVKPNTERSVSGGVGLVIIMCII